MEMEPLGLRDDRDDDGSDENSDDEETPLGGENYGGESQRAAQEVKSWDPFRAPIVEEESGSMESQVCMEVSLKITKVFFYILTFCIVLGGGVIAKGTLLFMTSQLRKTRPTTYCNAQIGKDKQFISMLPELERIAWIWCIFFAFMVPELGAFIRSLRICFFKSSKMPSFGQFILVCTTESMHTIGLAILVFVILPEMDAVKGAMITNCMCIVPGIMGLLSRRPNEPKGKLKMGFDVVAIIAQISGFIVWPLVDKNNNLWFISLAAILISIGWWENFLAVDSPIGDKFKIQELKKSLKDSRYATYLFVSLWKVIVFLVAMVVILWIQGENVDNIFNLFSESFASHPITIEEITPVLSGTVLPDLSEVTLTGDAIDNMSWGDTPMYVLFIQIGASWLCYVFGKFTCRILIQGFSFALPVNLTIPVTISVLIAMCGLRNGDPCYFSDTIPPYLFFDSPPVYFLNDFINQQMTWVWILWLVSQTWIMFHIWTPKCERLASTEKLFVLPMYDSLLIDQSLGLNRTYDDQKDCDTADLGEIHDHKPKTTLEMDEIRMDDVRPSDRITRIYACATMWHETKEEMVEFLKSIFRIDEDQCARRIAQTYLQVVDPDYYEYETHIFLDDGFDKVDAHSEDYQVNAYVKRLIHLMDKAASAVHLAHIRIRPPKKYPTPYGGRLEWSLPGKTKFVCHLKNKDKIRHRKRWSQVMYMYYLLGHRLMELNISVERKEAMAENTYLLTLDGDIDFQPNAVRLLIDLMKRNKNLGAACGRIHPIGSGPMVWYQMFEYAIGHWLQKSTEHVIGCVLCSPGCFSLFRAKALMDDNVMKKYTTKSDQARHYVQYDQGEDRWLCTLILQRGYRVEYSAASDAYTHAPEGFNDFYVQRRRWVPSTMANIFDLLFDFKRVVKINDNISMPYIIYLIMLMGGTILGPGTIFLMLVGAFVAAFRIDNWTSFLYNIIPILIFMVICYTCKTSVQLFFAALISTGYGLVMMAVLVGLGLQIMADGWLAPSSLFLFVIIAEMFIAALMHPQELYCLPAIIVYYITIPSMYLLLIIFSLFNMNDVTWGTRVGPEKKSPEEVEEEAKQAVKAKKGKTNFGFFTGGDSNETRGSFEFSFAGLFKCMFCTHPEGGEEKARLALISESISQVNKKLETLEKAIDAPAPVSTRRRSTIGGPAVYNNTVLGPLSEDNENDQGDDESISTVPSTMPREERDDLSNPYWIDDPELGKGEVDFLPENELHFWTDLLALYLYPIDGDKEEEKRISQELLELRDRSVFGFFMLNALFVLIVFLLQLNKDVLHIEWPFGTKTNITYEEGPQEVFLSIEYLELEPIGLVFVIFFALILAVQFTAMLIHRFGTLSHILASTELDWYCSKKAADLSPEALVNQNALTLVKRWQKISDENDDDKEEGGPGRRKTIKNMTEAKKRTKHVGTLDAAFKKNLMDPRKSVGGELGHRISMRRETLHALQERRETIIQDQERRKSRRLTVNADRLAENNNMGIPARSMRNSMRNSIIPSSNDGGQINRGFEAEAFDDEDNVAFRPQRPRPSGVTFRM